METEGVFVQRAAGLKSLPYIPRPDRLLELDLSQNLLILQPNAFQPFTKLRKLTLSATGLSVFPPFPGSLERLELADNQICRLPAGLKPCLSLTYLDISRNLISDLTPLARHANLSVLQAADNKIALLSGLEKLRQLSILNLDNNRVKDTGQIAILPHSLQFLSLRNTPVVRFFQGNVRLPGAFVALQDGQLVGTQYMGKRPEERDRTYKVSVGFIDLGKARPGSETQSRALTPVHFRAGERENQVQEMMEELSLLKRQNVLLEGKISSLEGLLDKSPQDSLLSDLISALDIDINEFSFSHNRFGQIVAVLQERERERKELHLQNGLLRRQIQALEGRNGICETETMRMCDLESQNVRLSGLLTDLKRENEQFKGKTESQEAKMMKIRSKNRDLLHLHQQEASKCTALQDQLSKLYSDYSKLLKAGLCSALEARAASPVPQSTPVPAQEAVLGRLEERMVKLQNKVKRLSGRPEEYYKKLKQCHRVIDTQNKCE